jgi:Trk K+ transport system NAD-binding subunit
VGRGIGALFAAKLPTWVRMAALLLIGFLIFESANYIPVWVEGILGVKIKIEPLLECMVAGFTVTNFTQFRKPFEDLLHDISPWVYVAFFTLTGVGLKLDILVNTIGIAAILFGVRLVAIVIGTYIGGTLAGEPREFRRFAGLGLITQAGIALGLARETAVFFPDTLGGEFSTMIISVVVLNEIFGPMLLKYSLRQVGEAQMPDGSSGEQRRLLILGVEPQSIALARQMTAKGWQVVVADTDPQRVEALAAEDIDERVIPEINQEVIIELIKGERDALVAMMDDDDANMRACMIAQDEGGLRSLVVRLRDVTRREDFVNMGVQVIDPSLAMVHLLEQSVNAPEAVKLLLQQDPDHQVAQITVTDKAIGGLQLRDLRLPGDVLILEISRNGQVIVPHGFSELRMSDKVTLIGSIDSLTEVTLKLGY